MIAEEKGPLAPNDDPVSPLVISALPPPPPPVKGPPTCKQRIHAFISLLQMYLTEILLLCVLSPYEDKPRAAAFNHFRCFLVLQKTLLASYCVVVTWEFNI